MAVAVKRGDNEILMSAQHFEIKAVEEDGAPRMLSFVGSDETPDRDNDIISVNGWDLKNFKMNPVFLWAHDYRTPPIGRAVKVAKEDGKLVFDIEFPEKGVYPFADLVYNLYKGGFMKATSVGFIGKDFEPRNDDAVKDLPEWRRGRKYKKQELLELSAVPVPANPMALQRAKSLGFINDEEESAVQAFMDGTFDGNALKAFKGLEGAYRAETTPETDPEDNKPEETPTPEGTEEGTNTPTGTEEQPQTPSENVENVEKSTDNVVKGGPVTVDVEKGIVTIELEGIGARSFTFEFLKQVDAVAVMKAGATLSKKNKDLLKAASDSILEVLASSESSNEEDKPPVPPDSAKGQKGVDGEGNETAGDPETPESTETPAEETPAPEGKDGEGEEDDKPEGSDDEDVIEIVDTEEETIEFDFGDEEVDAEGVKAAIQGAVKETLDKATGKV